MCIKLSAWRIATLIFLIFSAICTPSHSQDRSQAFKEATAQAVAAEKRGDRHQALRKYTDAIELTNSAPAYFNRAIFFIKIKDENNALADLNRSLSIDPNFTKALNSRAIILKKRGYYEAAMQDYNLAISIKPSEGLYFHNRGNLWSAMKRFDEAIKDFSAAIELKKHPRSYNDRGLALTAKGEFQAAIRDFSETIEMAPKDPRAYNNRGYVYLEMGNYTLALEDFNRAIELDKAYINPLFNRAKLYVRTGEHEFAERDFRRVIDAQPSRISAYIALGKNFEVRSDFKSAIDTYERALQINGANPVLIELLEIVRTRFANPEKNKLVVKPAISKNKKRVALLIANSKYQAVPTLSNPKNDIALLANALRKVGFSRVTELNDLSYQEMKIALSKFSGEIKAADEVLIYFAGHGIEVNGVNYMIPIDASNLSEENVSTKTINLDLIIQSAETAEGSKIRLILIDACRDNPFVVEEAKTTSSRSVGQGSLSSIKGRGLAKLEPATGTLVAFATRHGRVALDGSDGNSPFSKALATRIPQEPPIEVRRLFDYVRDDVSSATDKFQLPFVYGSLPSDQDFYFIN